MWIFSEVGFLSIVEDPEDSQRFKVRARFRGDLEKLVQRLADTTGERLEILETPGRDYRFRTFAPKPAVADVLRDVIAGIDYTNFKNSVHGDRIRDRAYLRCWEAMYDAQLAAL